MKKVSQLLSQLFCDSYHVDITGEYLQNRLYITHRGKKNLPLLIRTKKGAFSIMILNSYRAKIFCDSKCDSFKKEDRDMQKIVIEEVEPGDVCLMCGQGTYKQFAEDSGYNYLRCDRCEHERLIEKERKVQ